MFHDYINYNNTTNGYGNYFDCYFGTYLNAGYCKYS